MNFSYVICVGVNSKRTFKFKKKKELSLLDVQNPCIFQPEFETNGILCMGVNNKASPPGRHQEQAPKQRCTFSPTTFSSVQFTYGGTRNCSCVSDFSFCMLLALTCFVCFFFHTTRIRLRPRNGSARSTSLSHVHLVDQRPRRLAREGLTIDHQLACLCF